MYSEHILRFEPLILFLIYYTQKFLLDKVLGQKLEFV